MLDKIGLIGGVLTQEIAQARLALQGGLAGPAPVPGEGGFHQSGKMSSRSCP